MKGIDPTPHHARRRRAALAWHLFPVLLLVAVAPARAAETICVNSVLALTNAFVIAQTTDVPGGIQIQVVQGTYDLTGSVLLDPDRDVIRSALRLVGGYAPGCATRSPDAGLTVFSSASTGLALNWAGNRDLRIEGVTFSNFNSMIALSSWNGASGTVDIELRNVAIRGGVANTSAGAPGFGLWLSTFGAADTNWRLINVVVGDRVIGSSQTGGALCAVFAQGDGTSEFEDRLTVVNSTIARNQGFGASDSGLCVTDAAARLYNSILFAHEFRDLVGTDSIVDRYNNVIGSTGGNLVGVNQGTLTVSPQLNSDLSLDPASPAVNSGTGSVPGGLPAVDLVGNPRVVGVAVDRGAYENANQGLFAYTVTSGADAGPGSLRQAILDAQATPGANAILFNIPGALCPRTIDLQSVLPDITQDLIIDGSSQPGFIGNSSDVGYNGSRCVAIRRAGGSNLAHALRVPSNAPSDTTLTVDSLAFGGFNDAIHLAAGNGHRIVGSQFGGMVGSVVSLFGNGTAIRVTGGASGVTVGGDAPRALNAIGDASTGVLITTSGNSVVNNFVGTTPGGGAALPNAFGVIIAGPGNVVRENLIAGNSGPGLTLLGEGTTDNQVYDNIIGHRRGTTCFVFNNCPLPNDGFGIETALGASNNLMYNNLVAYNAQAGIRIGSGSGNRVTFNRLFANGGPEVDIAGAGYDSNDNDAASPPPDGNGGQNWPVLGAVSLAGAITVRGSLASREGSYQIVFYDSQDCDLNPLLLLRRGQAQRVLEARTVQIANAPPGANGSVEFTHVFVNRPQLRWLSAQARRLSSPGRDNVSEIGNCVELPLFADGFEPAP
jgi:parallel beta-helix repeat protein